MILPLSNESLRTAAEALRAGRLVAFPTETVYGLGGDGFNPAALARIFEAKGRPRFDPLILHIAEAAWLERVVRREALSQGMRDKLDRLCGAFWPGPLTLILPKQPEVPDLATSGLPTAAVRLPAHPAARELIRLFAAPVAAPSANPFGRLSPTRAEHVRDGLGDRLDLILDGGPCGVGLESTVLDLSAERPRILRPGGIPKEQIEALIGAVDTTLPPVGVGLPPSGAGPRSPGQLPSHYAPRTKLSLHPRGELLRFPCPAGEGRLFFNNTSWIAFQAAFFPERDLPAEGRFQILAPGGDLAEAAARLFELLHQLDTLGLRLIRAEEAPAEGLGNAINDRLRRAAAK